jgi:hypothetical protein
MTNTTVADRVKQGLKELRKLGVITQHKLNEAIAYVDSNVDEINEYSTSMSITEIEELVLLLC